MKELFPKEFINSSIEHYTFKVRRSHSGIYLSILIAISSLLLCLPFVHLNVTTLTSGIIDTKTQRYKLSSTVGGQLVFHQLVENRLVKKGDTILRLNSSSLEKELAQIKVRIQKLNNFLADLEILLHDPEKASPATSRYKVERFKYQAKLDQLIFNKQALKVIFQRQEKLLKERVIAQVEFDRDQSNYLRADKEIELFNKTSKSSWVEASINLKEELQTLLLRGKQIENELPKFTLIAPATGELQNVQSISIGQYTQAGSTLAEITPDSTLTAVCWVLPKKVGLLNRGLEGVFRIDAFNYNDWGQINGTITAISSDAYIINNQPLFKVTCSLDKSQLQLKNGFVGHLKKGMTFQSSFIVAKRSLYQLLYDKVDDWLNPKIL